MLTFCPCGCCVLRRTREGAAAVWPAGSRAVRGVVGSCLACVGPACSSVRWRQLQSAAMGLNCGRWMDGRWYSVCHVGPNDMRWTWWSASPNRPKEQAVSARAAAETLSAHRGPRQRHVCNVRQRPAKHPRLPIPPSHPARGTHATLWSRCMVKFNLVFQGWTCSTMPCCHAFISRYLQHTVIHLPILSCLSFRVPLAPALFKPTLRTSVQISSTCLSHLAAVPLAARRFDAVPGSSRQRSRRMKW
jgi:hypothetical protein